MIGKLNCDLFNTNRYLISNVPLNVKLTQNDSKFCLMHKTSDKLSNRHIICYSDTSYSKN